MGAPRKDRTGMVSVNNQGAKMTITKYVNAQDIEVTFESGFVVEHTQMQLFTRGSILDPYFKSQYGIGYMGMKTFYNKANEYKRQHSVWHSMLKRCYSEECKQYIWYDNCEVCEEWHNFSNFLQWYNDNSYELPEGMGTVDLDKDIKYHNNRIYSPDTCLLIPATINRMIDHRRTIFTGLPLGVSIDKKTSKYKARGRIDKIDKHFGIYDTIEEAFAVVKYEKEKELRKVAEIYKPYMPSEVYQAIINYEFLIDD